MMGYMEMWDSEETGEDKRRQIKSARNSGKHILNMLTNLLEFSRLQQNSAKLHFSRFNLTELMEDIVSMFRPLTEEKELGLEFENVAPVPLYVESDPMILKQILTNVVSNAVKYTMEGNITLRLEYNGQLIFTIIDSGIGMDMEDVPEIFKPFSRMQNPLKAEGSGFGLYVTKGLVKLLKGYIMVSSEKGRGTSVTITLPIQQITGDAIAGDTKNELPLKGNDASMKKGEKLQRILLFEDDIALGNMIKEYLVRNGYNVELCSDPSDINTFRKTISLFHIVFTDMQMTKISGTDILRMIRKEDANIPVWLMTAHDDYTTERAVAEGFSGLIRKPIRMSELTEIVSAGTKVRQQEKNRDGEEFPQLAALFGDDSETIRDILSGFVESSETEMQRLEELIDKGAFEEAQQLCHKIYPFLYQLDAEHLCITLRKMDRLRGESESAYPEWKEDLEKTIGEIREFAEGIRKKYL